MSESKESNNMSDEYYPQNDNCCNFQIAFCILGFLGIAMIATGAIQLVHLEEKDANIEAVAFISFFLISFGFILLIMHLFEACGFIPGGGTKTIAYLKHVMHEEEFVAHVNKLQQSSPKITFTIKCYHYEKKTFDTDDESDEGFESCESCFAEGPTRKNRVRVNTHCAEMEYPIVGHTVETFSKQQILAMLNIQHSKDPVLLHCRFDFDFHARDEVTESDYDSKLTDFYTDNTRDKHQDTRVVKSLSGDYTEQLVTVLHVNGSRTNKNLPWWMSVNFYRQLALLCMSVPYRKFLGRRATQVTWSITKHFSINDSSKFAEDHLQKSADSSLATAMKMDTGDGEDPKFPGDLGKDFHSDDPDAHDEPPATRADTIDTKTGVNGQKDDLGTQMPCADTKDVNAVPIPIADLRDPNAALPAIQISSADANKANSTPLQAGSNEQMMSKSWTESRTESSDVPPQAEAEIVISQI
eukprot:gnl/MRDRNA2_/MRDRNA2_61324_c0_seq2.p1 gnl/MRDRNA2_/MRDRNA2_61324_c0~~gnl/MRDRNA2_/MRDRNA2_61324_c0_seq2.p1  ORF type:complete len:499 (+),score=56.88 gnl/MRDRNA2_/MRDRNA2_61324_c0_seq2:93-1499(+)